MVIVTVNPGTSGTKIGYFENTGHVVVEKERIVFSGTPEEVVTQIKNHISVRGLSDFLFGIRIVHGGKNLTKPTEITSDIYQYLESIQSLAPLHNPISLAYIRLLQKEWPHIRIVAVFDTAFHASLPFTASSYALPQEYEQNYGVKRYGFHGLAYQSVVHLMSEQLLIEENDLSLIALQLGSGCSICAIDKGKSVDTSMGFSPLEGLISRTRTGDIDPAVVPYLVEKTGKSYEELFGIFNKNAGLLGVSGTQGHMNELVSSTTELSSKAFALFVYRIQKYIGAYQAILQKETPIILSGGISEHSREFWEAVFSNPYFGVLLSDIKPGELEKPVARISADESRRHVYVVFVDEEKEIALSTQELLLT